MTPFHWPGQAPRLPSFRSTFDRRKDLRLNFPRTISPAPSCRLAECQKVLPFACRIVATPFSLGEALAGTERVVETCPTPTPNFPRGIVATQGIWTQYPLLRRAYPGEGSTSSPLLIIQGSSRHFSTTGLAADPLGPFDGGGECLLKNVGFRELLGGRGVSHLYAPSPTPPRGTCHDWPPNHSSERHIPFRNDFSNRNFTPSLPLELRFRVRTRFLEASLLSRL